MRKRLEKVQRLLDAGAKVTVVSPTLHEMLRKLAALRKSFIADDIFAPTIWRASFWS